MKHNPLVTIAIPAYKDTFLNEAIKYIEILRL